MLKSRTRLDERFFHFNLTSCLIETERGCTLVKSKGQVP